FGQANQLSRLGCCDRSGQRCRVGHADILRSVHDSPPSDEAWIFSSLNHPCERMKSSIDVRATYVYNKGRDQRVRPSPITVVANYRAVDAGVEYFRGQNRLGGLSFD